MVPPLLFAISFLVPGVLLQVELLGEMRWFDRERGKTMVVHHMKNRHFAASLKGLDEPGGKFPDWPEDLTPEELKEWNALAQTDRENGKPPEPPIYLGRWLTMESDGSLPLLISPSYSKNGAKVRQVLTMGSEFVEIRDDEVDAWIDKTMMAGKR